MAAAVNQDFVTYKGDAVSPIFTVKNAAGTAIDISSVTEIAWQAQRDLATDPAVSKTKTGGGITFVTDGMDGKFQVAILATDTLAMDGFYLHSATITDIAGNPSTVSVGRMQVGIAPTWTYDPTSLSTNQLYRVRRLVGDVLIGDQQIQDNEVSYAIDLYSNDYLAAAECCRWIAAQYARKVNIVQAGGGGNLQTNYSDQAKAYTAKANELQTIGMSRGAGAMPYIGGISVTAKGAQVDDTDRVTPQFNIGMFDTTLPLPSVNNETLGNPAGGNGPTGSGGGVAP